MKIILTGAAGFIGMHCAEHLLERGDEVAGIDNINDYYDIGLKKDRLARLLRFPNFSFYQLDVVDRGGLEKVFSSVRPERVVHLAAQAGVRYSLVAPHAYVENNVVGFINILECCRSLTCGHLVYASSSSVYGGNGKIPFSEHDNVDHPINIYAATKKANELMAHAYSHLYGLPTTGLRFFTVYGPWGRPDMALFQFTRAMLAAEPIKVFNHGQMIRDFTYIDDIVAGIIRVLDAPPSPDPAFDAGMPDPSRSSAPYRIFNIGNNKPVELLVYIEALEKALGRTAQKEFLPMQMGDMRATFADISQLQAAVGFKPSTEVTPGVKKFVEWYRDYYGV
jgi:UDP-glucuronate 4-epimerase